MAHGRPGPMAEWGSCAEIWQMFMAMAGAWRCHGHGQRHNRPMAMGGHGAMGAMGPMGHMGAMGAMGVTIMAIMP